MPPLVTEVCLIGMFVTDMLTVEEKLALPCKKLKTDLQVILSTPSPLPHYSNELPVIGENDDLMSTCSGP